MASVSIVTVSELAFGELLFRDEIRDRRVRRREEEPGRHTRDAGEHHQALRTVDERQRREHAEAHEIRRDHESTA